MLSATLTLLGLLATGTPSTSAILEKAYVRSYVELRSMQYGLDPAYIDKIIECESGYNSEAIGDHGKAYSYMQFWEGTFNQFKQESGKTWLKYDNPDDHLELGLWAFANGKEKHWTCASML